MRPLPKNSARARCDGAGARRRDFPARALSSGILPDMRSQAGRGEVDWSDSLVYLAADREAGFILPCTRKPRSNLRILPQHTTRCANFESKRIACAIFLAHRRAIRL